MSTPMAAQRGRDRAGSTAAASGVDVTLYLSPRAVAWLAGHPRARRFVSSVWDTLTKLDQAGQCPGAIDALSPAMTWWWSMLSKRRKLCCPSVRPIA